MVRVEEVQMMCVGVVQTVCGEVDQVLCAEVNEESVNQVYLQIHVDGE